MTIKAEPVPDGARIFRGQSSTEGEPEIVVPLAKFQKIEDVDFVDDMAEAESGSSMPTVQGELDLGVTAVAVSLWSVFADLAFLPAIFGKACLFPPHPVPGGVEVTTKEVKFSIGQMNDGASWDVRHLRAIGVLMQLARSTTPPGPLVFSMSEFDARYSPDRRRSGTRRESNKDIIKGLQGNWVKFQYKDGRAGEFTVVSGLGFIIARDPDTGCLEEYCTLFLAPAFRDFESDNPGKIPFHVAAISRMTSKLAQAIISFAASRAVHRGADRKKENRNPWEIRAEKLLDQVHYKGRLRKSKSGRRRIFWRRARNKDGSFRLAVAEQMNGIKCGWPGDVRQTVVSFRESSDKKDWVVGFASLDSQRP